MRIGIDIRLKDETGVGRYIRNLVSRIKTIDTRNEYVFIDPPVRWHSVREQIAMPSEYGKYDVDLVHIPYFNVPLAYNKPFIITIHDVIVDHFPTGRASTHPLIVYKLKRLAYKKIMKHAIAASKAVIVPSLTTKTALLDLYGTQFADKTQVIYEGVDANIVLPVTRNQLPATSKYFLYVGNAYPHKNLERFVEAFEMVNKQQITNNNQPIKLVLVGKEDYFYARLKKKVEQASVNDSIVFTGYVSNEELAGLYQNAIALVYPSLMEGFGLPAIEAMRNNCLVLASDIPVFREICAGAAVYFDPKKTESIAGAMERVLHKQTWIHSLLKKGNARSKQFSWDKMVKETVKIYESSTSL